MLYTQQYFVAFCPDNTIKSYWTPYVIFWVSTSHVSNISVFPIVHKQMVCGLCRDRLVSADQAAASLPDIEDSCHPELLHSSERVSPLDLRRLLLTKAIAYATKMADLLGRNFTLFHTIISSSAWIRLSFQAATTVLHRLNRFSSK